MLENEAQKLPSDPLMLTFTLHEQCVDSLSIVSAYSDNFATAYGDEITDSFGFLDQTLRSITLKLQLDTPLCMPSQVGLGKAFFDDGENLLRISFFERSDFQYIGR